MRSPALAVFSAARRSSVPWAAAGLLGLGAVILAAQSCGNDAVGVDACRRIETARCEAAAVCPEWVGTASADERVKTCVEFYWDQCLHGIKGVTTSTGTGAALAEPADAQVQACVDAVGATRECASNKVASMAECSAELAAGEDASISPCDVITQRAHALGACAFVGTDQPAATPAGGGGSSADGGGSSSADGGGGGSADGGGGGSSSADGGGGSSSSSADGGGGGSSSSADGAGGSADP
ncbi:hypothetical protein AB3662_20000 [Sorangium cellulosum]|uniref:hypothetical protein n=1 Tax=Sorangium cellulosum TaxID=56 RepID=UPI003D9A6208